MRNVKAILIDPFECSVTETEHDASNYRDIYRLLSHPTMPVDCMTTAYVPWLKSGDALFVDDEGLLKPCLRFFLVNGYNQPLAGKGLILGSDDEGETIGAKAKLAKVQANVRFLHHMGDGHMMLVTDPLPADYDQPMPPAML